MAFERKTNHGSLFRNDKKTSDKHPHAKGDILAECSKCGHVNDYWMAAWTNTSQKGEKYQSVKLDPKDENRAKSEPEKGGGEFVLDDSVPFAPCKAI